MRDKEDIKVKEPRTINGYGQRNRELLFYGFVIAH